VVIFQNFFEFTYVLNPGAAFGFLAKSDSSFRHPFFIAVTIFAIIFIIYTYFSLKEEFRFSKLSLCFILAGAIGNFIDRVRLRAVIDFISVHYYDYYWPAFNIADALITVGIFLIAINIIIKQHKDEEVS
jgi:signal peptidase II